MQESILLGRGSQVHTAPAGQLWQALQGVPLSGKARLAFMTPAHHQVRNFVVRELVQRGTALPPAVIAAGLGLSEEQTTAILDDLERNLFFLVRDERGAVTWAFPFTVQPTAHRLTFNTGERLYGA